MADTVFSTQFPTYDMIWLCSKDETARIAGELNEAVVPIRILGVGTGEIAHGETSSTDRGEPEIGGSSRVFKFDVFDCVFLVHDQSGGR